MTTIDGMIQLSYELDGKAVIAGGAIRSILENNEPRDVDIFCQTKEDFQDVCDIVADFTGTGRQDYTKHTGRRFYNYISYGKYTIIDPVEIAGRKLYGDPEELIADFDIDVTQLYMNGQGKICGDVGTILHKIQNKQFTFTHFKDSKRRIASRAGKYASYGYELMNNPPPQYADTRVTKEEALDRMDDLELWTRRTSIAPVFNTTPTDEEWARLKAMGLKREHINTDESGAFLSNKGYYALNGWDDHCENLWNEYQEAEVDEDEESFAVKDARKYLKKKYSDSPWMLEGASDKDRIIKAAITMAETTLMVQSFHAMSKEQVKGVIDVIMNGLDDIAGRIS